jgi:sigma-B regulation protein RsbU (phosphoserine phosphatase)
VGTAYLSATAEAEVGGDFIDAWRDDGRGYFLIADVSGKGIDAAVNTAFVKYAIRTLASASRDPGEILARFNELHLRTISDPSVFVVVFLGSLDRDGKLRYASAGHELAFLRKEGVVHLLPVTGPVIGVFEGQKFETRVLDFESPEMLLLSTDGFTEARDGAGQMLGVELASQIVASGPDEPQALCDYLIVTITARSGGTITDDLALLSIAPVRAQASLEIG